MTVLVGSAIVLGWFGVHDLFGDTGYAVRLRAAIMLAASLYVLFTATAMLSLLLRRVLEATEAALAIVITGTIVAAASGSLLLVYQLVSGDYTLWLWVWLAMTVSGCAVAAWLYRNGAHVPYPKQFAAAVTITTFLAGANFAYSTLYQPAAQPVQVSVEVALGEPTFDAARTYASIPVKISFANTGNIGLHVLMSTYSVVGRRGHVAESDREQQQMNMAVQDFRPASKRTVLAGYDVLQSDRFVYEGTVFEPGDRTDAGRTVEVPLPTAYDALAVSAWVLVLRKDDVRLATDISRVHKTSWDSTGQHVVDAPGWAADPGVDFVQYSIPIGEASYLREKTRRRWEGAVWRVFGSPAPGRPPGSYISLRFRPAEEPADVGFDVAVADNRVAAERYGVTRSETGLDERSVHDLGLTAVPAS